MAEQILTWAADDAELIKSFSRLQEHLENIQKGFKESGKAQDEAFADIGKDVEGLQKNIDGLVQKLKGYRTEVDKTQKSGNIFKNVVNGIIDGLDDFGLGIRDRVNELKNKRDALKNVTTAIGGTNKSLKTFKVALASTGIGLLLVALGSLVAFLTKTQKGLDAVSRVGAVLGSVFDNIVERATRLGQSVAYLLNGEFEKAASSAKDAVAGFGDELLRDAQAADQLEQASQKLRKANRELSVEFSQQRAQMEELKSIAEDTTKSLSVRQKALEDAIKIENDLEAKRLANAKENLRIISKRNELGNSFTADLEAQAQAEIEVSEIQAESEGKRRENVNQLNALRKEAADLQKARLENERKIVEDLEKEYNSLFDNLKQQSLSAELSLLGDEERLIREREIAVAEVNKMYDALREAAQTLGKDTGAIDSQVEQLVKNIELEFRKQADELVGRVENTEAPKLRSGLEAVLSNPIRPKLDIELPETDLRTLSEKFRDGIFKTFGLGEGDNQLFDFAKEQIGGLFNVFKDGFTSSIDAELEANQALIDEINRRVDETQKALDRELALKEAGFANNFSLEKERLEKLQEERTKAEEARVELERQAAKRRLLADAASQVSSLATSAANIIKAESNKGLLGVALAIAGIATIFKIFSEAKANAAKAVDLPQFRTGTDYIEGEGTHTSDSIIARVSKGERIVAWEDNKKLLEAGIFNKDLARYAIIGKHILEQGVTAIPQMEAGREIRAYQARKAELEVGDRITKEDLKEAIKEGITAHLKELIKTNAERPHFIPNTGKGYTEMSKKGNTRTTRVVKK